MDKKELRKLSKNQLIEIIFQLLEKIEKLEQYLKSFENPHTPSSKVRSKENTVHDESSRFPGKPEGSNGAGIQMPKPDKEEDITKDKCPSCGEKLSRPYDNYSFTQIDIAQPSFITTRYHVFVYQCPCCKKDVDSGEKLCKGFYGPITSALIGYLKKEGLSCEAISSFFNEAYDMPISSTAVFNKVTELTLALTPEREKIQKGINQSEFNHLDETGLRKDGQNGYVWGASNPSCCLFQYDRSRGSEVAKEIIAGFDGTIITDDYKGYLWHTKRQLCWSHLLREAKEFAEQYDGAKAQYERLKSLYDKAKRAQDLNKPNQYDNLVWELEDIASCYHPLDGCRTMYAKLHDRGNLWLLGVKYPNVPLTNNHIERCLRKVVLHRNRIGCIRNHKGEMFVNTFLSCITTWNLQGKNVFQELLKYAS